MLEKEQRKIKKQVWLGERLTNYLLEYQTNTQAPNKDYERK